MKSILLLFISFIISNLNFNPSFAQSPTGNDYWFSFPANWEYGSTIRHIRLYISSIRKVEVSIYVGSNLKKKIYTIPFDVVTFDLTPLEAQIFVRDDRTPIPNDSVYKHSGIHITSNGAISVLAINRISFTSDGMALLPTAALGNDYIVASMPHFGTSTQFLPAQVMIIAPFDETEIIIKIPENNSSVNHIGGESFTVSMNKGDVYSMMTSKLNMDLSGTIIKSNKPVSVVAGHMCTYVPTSQYAACDYLVEMMFPNSLLGKTYISMPIFTRLKGDLYRVFTTEDSNKVSINEGGYQSIPIKGGENGKGFLEFISTPKKLTIITSEKPVKVEIYNNSQLFDGVPSDPFMMNIIPVEQFQNEASFYIPSDFQKNFINFVIDSVGFQSLKLNNKLVSILYDNSHLTYKIGTKTYFGKTLSLMPGFYTIKSNSKFGGNIYGFSEFDSYGTTLTGAFPETDTIAAKISSTFIDTCTGVFKKVATDTSNGIVPISNISAISVEYSNNFNITIDKFIQGASKSVMYNLNAVNLDLDASAIIKVTDMEGNTTLDSVYYYSKQLLLDLLISNYGDVKSGDVIANKLTIFNRTNNQVVVKQISLNQPNNWFSIIAPSTPIILNKSGFSNSSIDIDIKFNTNYKGVLKAELLVTDNCNKTYSVKLLANTSCAIISAHDLNFGIPTNTGVVYTQNGIVENISNDSSELIIYKIRGPFGFKENDVFYLANGFYYPSIDNPLVLKGGLQLSIPIFFKAKDKKVYFDSIIISSNSCLDKNTDSIIYLNSTTSSVLEEKTISNFDVTPNPASNQTLLKYKLIKNDIVNILITDVNGKVIQVLKNSFEQKGDHSFKLDLNSIPSGNYECLIKCGSQSFLKKLIVLK